MRRIVAAPSLLIIASLVASSAASCTHVEQDGHHSYERVLAAQAMTAATAADCLPVSFPKERFILQFRGLLDLASAEPGAPPSANQEEMSIVLINALDAELLPVKNSKLIKDHEPVLLFDKALNGTLGGKTGSTLREQSLVDVDVRIEERSSGLQVQLHREAIGTMPSSMDECSLNWLPLIDALVPPPPASHPLRTGVFTSAPPKLVTSGFAIEEGEAFTGEFFMKDADPSKVCPVTLKTGLVRALATGFNVAVPATNRTLTMKVSSSPNPWVFTLPPGVDEGVLTIWNRPVVQGGRYDFSGHFALRENFESSTGTVPQLDHAECLTGIGPGENPQCSPADNDYPP